MNFLGKTLKSFFREKFEAWGRKVRQGALYITTKENLSFYFKITKIDETKNYLLEKIKHKDLVNENHKKVCRALITLNIFLLLFLLSVDVFHFLNLLH